MSKAVSLWLKNKWYVILESSSEDLQKESKQTSS